MRSWRLLVVALILASSMPAAVALPVPLVRLTRVATLSQPIALATRTGDSRMFFAEKGGRVVALQGSNVSIVLDLTTEVNPGSEQGLLGLAFSPDGGTMVVNFIDRVGVGRTHVTAFTMSGGAVVLGSRTELMIIDQPYGNHNGGHLAFGPDGFLYVALGDGGSFGDPHNNGQRLDTLLGKILRIDPRPGSNPPYVVPADNPFVGTSGARGEIWAYGLRNPWRFSFDRLTGDLWIGDVGQNLWEEIDYRSVASRGGENYGWNMMEGNHSYEGSPPPGHVGPLYEYPHAGGNCSVTGGYVYRGARIPALQGDYVFIDFCAGRIQALVAAAGLVRVPLDLGVSASSVSSFGEDAAGELYVMSLGGTVWRIDPAM